jgi:hypothetical protein
MKHRKVYEIPANWAAVKHSGRVPEVFEALIASNDPLQVQALLIRVFVPEPEEFWNNLSDERLYELIKAVEWMMNEPFYTRLIDHFTHKGKTYWTPEESLFDLCGFEFNECESFAELMTANTEESAKALDMLCAVLCSPTHERARYNANEASHRRDEFADLPGWVKLYLARHYVGCKQRLAELYEPIFATASSDKKNEEEEEHEPASFGWIGTFMNIAYCGPFGTFEQVGQTNLHDICAYLVICKERADKQAEQQQRQQSITSNR